ncbi:helix-turn-helix transcriptional regulator [Pseudomonas sp. N040]|uniref:helix-turn-helix transcriptional regulator n=1 Tax=Pseudomonas sp. N040 TaxID=2785325 RepID=UPI0018A29020|nr:response regulator transcription factor [Pseudomonas sp. N040]MBF7728655.1 response regulator transcription factor [Pseudomonas sp. N040]MBW7012295.1 response regulator transcription factor [Pseudomonas sp. N040]
MIPHAPISPRLLWFDLTHDQSGPNCLTAFADTCQITLVRDLQACRQRLNTGQSPDMICMHYDRPDAVGLDLLLQVKRAAPSIPITMLSLQHSEELATWAFRSGVWEFLPWPLPPAERQRYLQVLHQLCQLRGSQHAECRQPLLRTNSLPDSVRLTAQYQRQQPLLSAVHYIEEHFHEHIEQKAVAEQCGMTPFRFSRLFKQTYGIGYLEFIQRKRMEKAEELLCNSEMPITSIAYAVGFQDPSYFARAFKQYFGCCPSQLRQEDSAPSLFTDESTSCPVEQ